MSTPLISVDDADYDVVVLGVPVDDGMSFRSGQRLAPRAIREYSRFKRADGSEMADTSTGRLLAPPKLRIADAGDVVVWPGQHDRTLDSIRSAVAEIGGSALPLILGGDHSITYGSFVGTRQSLGDDRLPLGLLHFDAHLDTEGPYATLPAVHHGNPFSSLIDENHLEGSHMVSIGIRGWAEAGLVRAADAYGVKRYGMDEISERSLAAVVAEAVEYLRSRCASVYVSFDVDCFDPADVPGTGTPSFGGLRVPEVTRLLAELRHLPVAAFDLVELAPALDPSGRSTVAACSVLWHFLSLGLAGASPSD